MLTDIRRIEEFTLSAWPALGEVLLDGWLLRFAGGFTGRSNSAHPMYPPAAAGAYADPAAVREKVRACERVYEAAGLPPRFKLTPASVPAGLDRVLADAGYRDAGGASVQVCDLAEADVAPAASARAWDGPAAEWLDAYAAFNGLPVRHRDTLAAIVAAIVPRRRLLAIEEGGELVACGLGVVLPPFVGLFDIATRPDRRRRGLGRRVVGDLLDWGREHGATVGCLQVVPENAPAVALYASLGFREAYRYRYLVRDTGV